MWEMAKGGGETIFINSLQLFSFSSRVTSEFEVLVSILSWFGLGAVSEGVWRKYLRSCMYFYVL